MINLAIFCKTLFDSAWALAMSLIGVLAFVVLFVWAMLNMGDAVLGMVAKIPFLTRIFEQALGINLSGAVSINTLFAMCFTHGVTLALSWTVIIATATRITAGEVERGTADLLLTLPVTRIEVYTSASLVLLIASGLLSFAPILGIWIALLIFETEEAVMISRYIAPATNFLCLNLAVSGLTAMIAGILNRRGLAVGISVGTVVGSAMIGILLPLIPALDAIRWISLLTYFRPVDVVRLEIWPVNHMTVLLCLAIVCWAVGLIVFWRKDIPTA